MLQGWLLPWGVRLNNILRFYIYRYHLYEICFIDEAHPLYHSEDKTGMAPPTEEIYEKAPPIVAKKLNYLTEKRILLVDLR